MIGAIGAAYALWRAWKDRRGVRSGFPVGWIVINEVHRWTADDLDRIRTALVPGSPVMVAPEPMLRWEFRK